ncbi:MAG: hypothetical protein LBT38_10675 [Deltaproteobacteria bacterium]|jgi:hypothetical protein|nr:hypothetical protein [Deltaproteobacteria bacterium]
MSKPFKKILKIFAFSLVSLILIFYLTSISGLLGSIIGLIAAYGVYVYFKPTEEITIPEPPEPIEVKTKKSILQCIEQYNYYRINNILTYNDEIEEIIRLSNLFINQKELLIKTYNSHISINQETYNQFLSILDDIENIITSIFNYILDKLPLYDHEEYKILFKSPNKPEDYDRRVIKFKANSIYLNGEIDKINVNITKMIFLQQLLSKIISFSFNKGDNLKNMDIDRFIESLQL